MKKLSIAAIAVLVFDGCGGEGGGENVESEPKIEKILSTDTYFSNTTNRTCQENNLSYGQCVLGFMELEDNKKKICVMQKNCTSGIETRVQNGKVASGVKYIEPIFAKTNDKTYNCTSSALSPVLYITAAYCVKDRAITDASIEHADIETDIALVRFSKARFKAEYANTSKPKDEIIYKNQELTYYGFAGSKTLKMGITRFDSYENGKIRTYSDTNLAEHGDSGGALLLENKILGVLSSFVPSRGYIYFGNVVGVRGIVEDSLKDETYRSIQLSKGWNLISNFSNKPITIGETTIALVLVNGELTPVKEIEPAQVFWVFSQAPAVDIFFDGERYDKNNEYTEQWRYYGVSETTDLSKIENIEAYKYTGGEWLYNPSFVYPGEGYIARKSY